MRRFGAHGRGIVLCSKRCEDEELVQPLQYFMQKVRGLGSALCTVDAYRQPLCSSQAGLNPMQFVVPDGVPSTETIAAAQDIARRLGASFVVGMGGGGVQETARVLAAALAHNGTLREFSKDMGGEREFTFPSLPTVIMPTLPAALELASTSYALFKNEALFPLHPLTDSPRLALVDPGLYSNAPQPTVGMATAATLAHAASAMLSGSSACLQPATEAVRALLRHGADAAERRDAHAVDAVALASVLTSAAMATSPGNHARAVGLGVVGRYRLPYSEVVGGLMPSIVSHAAEAVAAAEEAGGVDEGSLAVASRGLELLETLLAESTGHTPGQGLEGALSQWAQPLQLPQLSDHDFTDADFERMASSAEGDPAMVSTLAPLSRSTVLDMLREA